MRRATLALCLMLTAPDAAGGALDPYRWEARPILVFAPGEDDPRLARQLQRFAGAEAALADRRTVVIVDTEPGSALRRRFEPQGFTVILVGLDGGEKLRRGDVLEPRELNALIDTMPMRQRELRRQGE